MVTLTGGDKLDAFLRDLERRATRGGTLRVGFLEGATYPDGTSVAMVAVTQNYGSPARGVPPRPFFSNMIADKSPSWPASFETVFRSANYDGHKALELFGQGVAAQLRASIITTSDPPLSPVTLLLRDRFPTDDGYTFADVLQARRDIAAGEAVPSGHSNPLVWGGTLLNSVDAEVVE
jgi:hypothetical protein